MSSQTLHVHFENDEGAPDVFKSTPALLAAACARHPDTAAAITTSFGLDGKDLPKVLPTADVLVGFNYPRAAFTPGAAPNLKLIQVTGAGVEQLMPMDWIPPGVTVANASGAHAQKAGEYVTMALLMLNSRLPLFMDAKAAGSWVREFSPTITRKTALIIGLGGMGGAAASAAKALRMTVLGARPSGKPHPAVDKMYTLDGLDEALRHADFLVAAVPSTESSRGLIDKRRLDLMRPGSGVVNIGRAAVVDYAALAAKLRDGGLSGAVLDVFDKEPLPASSELWATPNLVITPHISSDDSETYMEGVMEILFDNLGCLINGLPLNNQVDRTKGY